MTTRKQGSRELGQYSIYNPPASGLDLLRTRSEKYETRLHPTGQQWGDKVRKDYERQQRGGDNPPPPLLHLQR